MLKIKSKQIILFISDIILFVASLYLALFVRNFDRTDSLALSDHIFVFFPIFVILIALYYSFDFYDFELFQTKLKKFSRLVNIHVFLLFISFTYFYIFSSFTSLTPKTILFLFVVVNVLLSTIWRVMLVPSFLKPLKKVKTLLIADSEEYNELKETVNSHNFYPFYFVSHLNVKEYELEEDDTAVEKLRNILEENKIRQVVIDIRDERTNNLLPFLYNLASQRKIDVFDAAGVYEDIMKKMPMRGVGHFWFFESVKLNIRAYEFAKRIIDIILSLPIFVVWIILHSFVALAIKLDSKGVIFVIQERYGQGGKIIKLYKYRTMTFSDEGMWLKEKNNPNKVTRVGYWLRKSRIDELPQVLSVLKGDISFIGPRPDMLAFGGRLSAAIPFYMMRYTVRPGLSGWAQVNQELPPQSIEENKIRTQYDLYYVKNRSLILDFFIMVKTFKVLVLRNGM